MQKTDTAELAAAKNEASDLRNQIKMERQAHQDRVEQLIAHTERMRTALEASRPYISMVLDEKKEWLDLENKLAIASDAETVHTAITATPTQSLAAHDAALLREVAKRFAYRRNDGDWTIHPDSLTDEADRIAKEAQ